jgi:virulence factor
MINSLLNRARAFRKAQYFKNGLFHTKKKYAFVGLGMHSLTNLYPVLRHYGIHLKYICTKGSSWKHDLVHIFPETTFTNRQEDILEDREIEGIFISASPAAHFGLLQKALESGKKVFIEKPPCQSLSELQQLIDIGGSVVCKVGLQRRYWPGTRFVKRKIMNARSYTYQFHTGSYIDGDIFTELFIHPVDYALFLFGAADIKSRSIIKDPTGVTAQIHLVHHNNVTGLIECSTRHSWNNPVDGLAIDSDKEYLTVQYPLLVEGKQKPSRIMNIPYERILNQPTVIHEYFSAKNLILPVQELNTVYLQGFYSELETFIKIVEENDTSSAKNDLPELIQLYQVLEALKENY